MCYPWLCFSQFRENQHASKRRAALCRHLRPPHSSGALVELGCRPVFAQAQGARGLTPSLTIRIIHHDPRGTPSLPAAFRSEGWPASRNGGRLQIGNPGRLRRNSHFCPQRACPPARLFPKEPECACSSPRRR